MVLLVLLLVLILLLVAVVIPGTIEIKFLQAR
jgi:hypothetical protein